MLGNRPAETRDVSLEGPYSTMDIYRITENGVGYTLVHLYGRSSFIKRSYQPSERCELSYNKLEYIDEECDGRVDSGRLPGGSLRHIKSLTESGREIVVSGYKSGLDAFIPDR